MDDERNDLSLEQQRYGKNKATAINRTYINSGEYRAKFDRITNNKAVNRILYEKAKEMLYHRSRTKIEDMYWIDEKTGKVVAKIINQTSTVIERVEYTKAIRAAIHNRKDLITLHTHPQSMPPSIADFNSMFYNGYADSLVICHDGKIFKYYANEEISEQLYYLNIQKFISNNFTEYESQYKTLQKLMKNYDLNFWEVIP